ncbi:MAG TPA: hypothetical protein VFE52_05335 [Devosia sp.]|nr:hypothetical protein [Devosia sp.]
MSYTDQLWFLAFVVSPAMVVAGAYVAVRLHERALHKSHPRHPAE